MFWVNTVSPLQTIEDIKQFVNVSLESDWKSGVSINPAQVHVMFEKEPLNFDWKNGFARTQDLKAVNLFNYAMMGWHREMMKSSLPVNYLINIPSLSLLHDGEVSC